MSEISRRRGAEAYAALLGALCSGAVREAAGEGAGQPEPYGEMELQGCWQAGLLGAGGDTLRHGPVRVVDFGEWNRGEGPDFLRAELMLGGRRLRGDIEWDTRAQDWEDLGHGSNPDYDRVVLHVVLGEVPQGWFTRNSRHEEVAVLRMDPAVCRCALGYSELMPVCGADCIRAPLSAMPLEKIQTLLEGIAWYRRQKKRELFCRKCEQLGERQTWYEAWAGTLGYRANKVAMQLLARRAPLDELGGEAEAVLFGTAGFLSPVLPPQASPESRQYHRRVWDAWWPRRDSFALDSSRRIPWSHAPVRPLNHPHRRVAALALSVLHWAELEPFLTAQGAPRLTSLLASLRHPYWSRHCTLPSAALSRDCALVGRERLRDFLVNHVLVQDESELAWESYLSMRESRPASRVQKLAAGLFGRREDLAPLLQCCYAQQALLQIGADFGQAHDGGECSFPQQLQEWGLL